MFDLQIIKSKLLLFLGAKRIWLRGSFFGPTAPDLDNASGGDIMNKTSNTIRTMCEIGLFAAIGFALDELQGILSKGVFINGGSIGFAMIAVIIISYRRGWLSGVLTGLIMGLLDIATSAYILHPAQLMLDYILPYALVGIAGLFKPLFDNSDSKKMKIGFLILGTVVGGIAKLLSHYLAGVIFWADPAGFAWNLNEVNVYLYCFIYNIAFIGPSIILTAGLLTVAYTNAPRILEVKREVQQIDESKKDLTPLISSIGFIAVGAFFFTFFLIAYINSFESYQEEGAFGYDFDPNCTVIFILGLAVMLLGINSLIKVRLDRYSYVTASAALVFITATSFIFGLARLIRAYVKEKDPTIYWIWFGVGLFILLLSIYFLVYSALIRKKKQASTN